MIYFCVSLYFCLNFYILWRLDEEDTQYSKRERWSYILLGVVISVVALYKAGAIKISTKSTIYGVGSKLYLTSINQSVDVDAINKDYFCVKRFLFFYKITKRKNNGE